MTYQVVAGMAVQSCILTIVLLQIECIVFIAQTLLLTGYSNRWLGKKVLVKATLSALAMAGL